MPCTNGGNAAAWIYRIVLEDILGIRKQGNTLHINPCVPADLDDYSVTLRYADSEYLLRFHEASRIRSGAFVLVENGQTLLGNVISVDGAARREIDIYPKDRE